MDFASVLGRNCHFETCHSESAEADSLWIPERKTRYTEWWKESAFHRNRTHLWLFALILDSREWMRLATANLFLTVPLLPGKN